MIAQIRINRVNQIRKKTRKRKIKIRKKEIKIEHLALKLAKRIRNQRRISTRRKIKRKIKTRVNLDQQLRKVENPSNVVEPVQMIVMKKNQTIGLLAMLELIMVMPCFFLMILIFGVITCLKNCMIQIIQIVHLMLITLSLSQGFSSLKISIMPGNRFNL